MILNTVALSKQFDRHLALDSVSLQVREGDCHQLCVAGAVDADAQNPETIELGDRKSILRSWATLYYGWIVHVLRQ